MSMKKGNFVYIDHSNTRDSLRALGYKNLDWAGLMNMLKTKQNVTRVYIYAGYRTESEKVALKKLEKHGYIVNLKKLMVYPPKQIKRNLKCKSCGVRDEYTITKQSREKANCDAELTLDSINDGVRKKYDGVIVFSADGDFTRVYEYISETLNKNVVVYAPMSGNAGLRTARSVKAMYSKSIIKINSLEGILGPTGYGVK